MNYSQLNNPSQLFWLFCLVKTVCYSVWLCWRWHLHGNVIHFAQISHLLLWNICTKASSKQVLQITINIFILPIQRFYVLLLTNPSINHIIAAPLLLLRWASSWAATASSSQGINSFCSEHAAVVLPTVGTLHFPFFKINDRMRNPRQHDSSPTRVLFIPHLNHNYDT